ncbi:MAG: DinB family protein [Actinomycetes bacterium]
MTWTAPAVDRPTSPNVADERTAAEGLLEYHRATLLWKCAGLTADQLKTRAVKPSSLSLLGLVRHMADVERVWFRRRVAGEPIEALHWTDASPDGDFDEVDSADAGADFAVYAAEVEAARAIQAGHDFDDTFVVRRRDGTEETVDVRALVLHMIEEYARHNGHADLLRECIDGTTGE